jgi:branched-chain amino acid transport system permease protein
MQSMSSSRKLLFALMAVAALVPFALTSQYLVSLAMLTVFSAFLGQAWNLSGGFGGLISFGHSLFFGLGGYVAALFATRWGISPWLALPTAALVGGLAGAVVGFAAFRAGLRGAYFALVTLAFAEAFRVLATALAFTGGGQGINLPLRMGFWNFQFADRRASYAIALALLLLATGCALWLRRSRFGARLVAIRENEDAARALGVDVVRTKTAALALSGAVTALGGVVYCQTYLFIDPEIGFGVERSVEMLLVAMIGGAGTVWGPIFGAVALHAVADTARAWIQTPGFAPMLYGVVLLLIIAVLPGGLASLRRRRKHA